MTALEWYFRIYMQTKSPVWLYFHEDVLQPKQPGLQQSMPTYAVSIHLGL